MLPLPATRSRTRRMEVRTVTISSTKITGFFTSVRGSSLAKAEPTAGQTMAGSNSAEIAMPLRGVELCMGVASGLIGRVEVTCGHRQVLDDGPKRERREKGEATKNDDHADDQADEEAARRREGAGRGGHDFFCSQRAGNRQRWNDHPEPAHQHRQGTGRVVPERVPAQP